MSNYSAQDAIDAISQKLQYARSYQMPTVNLPTPAVEYIYQLLLTGVEMTEWTVDSPPEMSHDDYNNGVTARLGVLLAVLSGMTIVEEEYI